MRILSIVFFLLSNLLIAQNFTITGKIINQKNKEELRGANIYIEELKIGTASDESGSFILSNIHSGDYHLRLSYIGFSTKIVKIKLYKNIKLKIELLPSIINLSETIVKGKRAVLRETPVAFSNVTSKQISSELGSRYITSALGKLPSLYVSNQGGGFADSRLNIRGYDQTSISVMINGIPINNPENGEVYWSNWADMSNVINYIQVQRGLSAAPYSVSSVGGVVNIVTNGSLAANKFVKLSTQFASDNFNKIAVSFSSPLLSNMNLVGMISKTKWNGYADQTWADMFTYYFALGMQFGKNLLEFQIMGSPQKHGQRITPHTINTWKSLGYRYNSDWGYLKGNPLNARDNEFHKPSITINHILQINNNTNLTNVLYLSHAKGGGHVPPWSGFEAADDGTIDFDKVWKANSSNIDSAYSTDLHRSMSALRFTYHIHNWAAFRSTFDYKKNNFNYTIGIDGKYYYAQNYSTLDNLIGGDYYIGSGDVNQSPNTLLFTGNKVDYDADSYVRSVGSFGQVEYNSSKLDVYANIAFATTGYDRIDFFNYKNNNPKRETGWKTFSTYTIKLGSNYNLNSLNNIYFNIGNYSKAPLSMNVYTYTNELYKNVKNENIFSSEFGYGFNSKSIKLNVNLFYTLWKDKVLNFNVYLPDTYAYFHSNVYGAKSLHKGIEADGEFMVAKELSINGMFSLGSYKWLNDVKTILIPEGDVNNTIEFNSKISGLYEGNSPMTKIGFGFKYKQEISDIVNYYLSADYQFFGKYYSQFDPVSRSFNSSQNVQSWRIPDYYTIDIHTGITISSNSKYYKKLSLKLSIFNILDNRNIIQAIDGKNHDANSALVWFNRERWISGTVSLEF